MANDFACFAIATVFSLGTQLSVTSIATKRRWKRMCLLVLSPPSLFSPSLLSTGIVVVVLMHLCVFGSAVVY